MSNKVLHTVVLAGCYLRLQGSYKQGMVGAPACAAKAGSDGGVLLSPSSSCPPL